MDFSIGTLNHFAPEQKSEMAILYTDQTLM
jgi:hypothetical protein